MSDLFHPNFTFKQVDKVVETMVNINRHIYQVLTKRPERLIEYVNWCKENNRTYTLGNTKHIWMGVTVELPQYYNRIRLLSQVDLFPVKFLSIEPCLGSMPDIPLQDIDWVIVGGESVPGARPMKVDWVRGIRDQILNQDIPFFFKQWGGVKDKRGQDKAILDGRLHHDYPSI